MILVHFKTYCQEEIWKVTDNESVPLSTSDVKFDPPQLIPNKSHDYEVKMNTVSYCSHSTDASLILHNDFQIKNDSQIKNDAQSKNDSQITND